MIQNLVKVETEFEKSLTCLSGHQMGSNQEKIERLTISCHALGAFLVALRTATPGVERFEFDTSDTEVSQNFLYSTAQCTHCTQYFKHQGIRGEPSSSEILILIKI